MSKNINPDVKKLLTERIAYERKLNEKSKVIDAKRKTQAVVAGTLLATTLSSGISPAFADSRYENPDYKGIGYISVVEEVGPQGDGSSISSGEGDAGGVSYGLTQLSSAVGSADEFVDNYLKENYPEFYKFFENAGKAGTDSFNKAWTNAYNHNPGEFERIQLENKEVNFVQPAYEKVKEKFGIDLLSTRARTEFLHSTAVQFGPDGVAQLVENSGVTKKMDDEELLSKLADEKYKSVGTYKFLKCSEEVRESVRGRFKREKEEYIKIAKEEKGPLLEDEIDYTLMESESSSDELVETAKSYLNQGTTYKMGGKNTKQLDCSGYVSLVYQDMGLDINEMMTNAGKFRNDSKKISRDELKEGDLVFWHDKTGTKHASVFHIGIYIGDDTVVDCSPDHNGVGTRKLSSLQDNSNRYYTFGRYEKLQEKIDSNTSDTKSDIYLDLSETDEFESDIEISESVEEKFEDETVEEATKEETTNEDESIVDEETTKEETTNEDESIVDEEATEEESTDEDESVIDEEATDEEAEEDESIVDEEATEEESTDEDESIVDEETTEEAQETVEEETTEDVEETIEETTDEADETETAEEDESIVDEEATEEESTNEDESIVEEEATEETTEEVEEETTEEATEEVEEEATEETTEEVEETVEEEATEEVEETVEVETEESTDAEVEVEENTKVEESESKTEEAKSEVEVKEEVKEVKEDKVDTNKNVETEKETKTESTQESTQESTTEEVKVEKEDASSTDNNASAEESSPDVDTDSQIKEESTVLMSSSEARIQELEKKLENNLFANLFRG